MLRSPFLAVASASAAPGIAPERIESEATSDERDRPWNVVVWNDPVTLMSYVVYVLRKLFGFDESKATRLMLQIHHEGRAIVASGTREHSEMNVHRLHAHGLQATLSQD